MGTLEQANIHNKDQHAGWLSREAERWTRDDVDEGNRRRHEVSEKGRALTWGNAITATDCPASGGTARRSSLADVTRAPTPIKW